MIRTFVPGGSVCLVGVLPHLLTAPARSVYSYLLLLLLLGAWSMEHADRQTDNSGEASEDPNLNLSNQA